MKYGIFSDVHSNLEALDAVLQCLEQKKVDGFISAGDLVGYGPNPNEVIWRIRNLSNLLIVAGNHDWAVAGFKELTWFNDFAARAIIWTKRQIKEDNRNFLRQLSRQVETSKFTVVHGSPRDPIDEYLLTEDIFKENLTSFDSPLCFIGHTHVPKVFCQTAAGNTETKNPGNEGKTKIHPEAKMIFNSGSVGQPRDGDTRTCCAVYDTDTEEITFYRVEYNFGLTQEKMKRCQLPIFLIERLSYGR